MDIYLHAYVIGLITGLVIDRFLRFVVDYRWTHRRVRSDR